jgi:spore coat polysaccharide biosynthesis predicted glycosyltransferase SpsG
MIRADGGLIQTQRGPQNVASGHLMRMLNFAWEWKKHGGNVTLAALHSCQGIKSLVNRFSELGCSYVSIRADWAGDHKDAEAVLDYISRLAVNVLYLDSYFFDSAYRQLLRNAGVPIISQVDGPSDEPLYADLVVSGHLGVHITPQSSQASSHLMLGPQFAYLHPQFAKWNGIKRSVPDLALKLLLTFGGSDPLRDTDRCLRALLYVDLGPSGNTWISNLQVTIVLGAGYQQREVTTKLAQELHSTRGTLVTIVQDVKNMAEIMSECDIACSAPGGTVLELLCVGVPTALQVISSTHVPIAERLKQQGVCEVIGDSRTIHSNKNSEEMAEKIARVLYALAADKQRRSRMASVGQQLVDGQGASRAVHRIKELLKFERQV